MKDQREEKAAGPPEGVRTDADAGSHEGTAKPLSVSEDFSKSDVPSNPLPEPEPELHIQIPFAGRITLPRAPPTESSPEETYDKDAGPAFLKVKGTLNMRRSVRARKPREGVRPGEKLAVKNGFKHVDVPPIEAKPSPKANAEAKAEPDQKSDSVPEPVVEAQLETDPEPESSGEGGKNVHLVMEGSFVVFDEATQRWADVESQNSTRFDHGSGRARIRGSVWGPGDGSGLAVMTVGRDSVDNESKIKGKNKKGADGDDDSDNDDDDDDDDAAYAGCFPTGGRGKAIMQGFNRTGCALTATLQLGVDVDADYVTARRQTEQEEELLGVDRYGFYLGSDRHDAAGIRGEVSAEKQRSYALLESRRAQKWHLMRTEKGGILKHRKLHSRTRKGIPDSVRAFAWQELAGSDPRQRQLWYRGGRDYASYLAHASDPANSNTYTEPGGVIDRDLPRTFPNSRMFGGGTGEAAKGQAKMRNVLFAYASYDPGLGYTQGMNFIVAMFLAYMDEEETFWLLVAVMRREKYALSALFDLKNGQAEKLLGGLESMVNKRFSKLAKHLEKQNMLTMMYAMEWILTLFTRSFPFAMVVQVWDQFLLEGWSSIFRVALALLQLNEKALRKKSFEEMMLFFKSMPRAVVTKYVMRAANAIRVKDSDFPRLKLTPPSSGSSTAEDSVEPGKTHE